MSRQPSGNGPCVVKTIRKVLLFVAACATFLVWGSAFAGESTSTVAKVYVGDGGELKVVLSNNCQGLFPATDNTSRLALGLFLTAKASGWTVTIRYSDTRQSCDDSGRATLQGVWLN